MKLWCVYRLYMKDWNYFDVFSRLYQSFVKVGVWLFTESLNTQKKLQFEFHIYCTNQIYWPVLKHGPRSVTLVQVFDVASSIAQWKYIQRLSLLWCQTMHFVASASSGFFFCERFEIKHDRYDPKDGELYLRRVKPGETLVEARSVTDVQIVRLTWV